ncbi:MAG: 30S ribosome-binding factor RbfA [Alphaproteobacteria bacterium]|nr:30S ribosome-binding factor RbfA [Alphaproteobacteria bacterium]
MTRSRKHLAPTQRMLRVGELVRHALSDMFMRGDIIDPEIDGATITVPEVRMTPDLKLAKAFIMPLGGRNADEIVKALNRHARFIRGDVGHRIDLKYAPEIRFYVDDSFEEADRIEALLRSDRVRRDLRSDEDADGED